MEVQVNKTLMQSPVQYCCGTVLVPLRYCYGTVMVRSGYGSVQFEITRVRSRARVDVEPRVRRENEQTLIPTLASFSAITVGLYPPLNQ